MTAANPRSRVVEAICDAYVAECERIEKGLDVFPAPASPDWVPPPVVLPRVYQVDAFTRAIDAARDQHRDVTGDEVLAAEDAVLSLYKKSPAAAALPEPEYAEED